MIPQLNKYLVSSLLLGLTLTQTVIAEGGGQSGGGGNAIVCFSNPSVVKKIRDSKKQNGGGYISNEDIPFITSVEMLDLYLAKQPRTTPYEKYYPELVSAHPNESEGQFQERLMNRFNKLVPEIEHTFKDVESKLFTFRGVRNGIAPIDDVNPLEIYDNERCVRATIIAQFKEKNTETSVIYDDRIFQLPISIFNVENRVAGRLHEYAYYIAREVGFSKNIKVDATLAQNFVGKLFQKNLTLGELINAYYALYFMLPIQPQSVINYNFYNLPLSFVLKANQSINNLLKEKKLLFEQNIKDLETVKFGLILPFLFVSEIIMDTAYDIKLKKIKEKCNTLFEEESQMYDEKKAAVLEIVRLELNKIKVLLPAHNEKFYEKMEKLYTEKIQSSQISKKFSDRYNSGYGTITCLINYNFEFHEYFGATLFQDILNIEI